MGLRPPDTPSFQIKNKSFLRSFMLSEKAQREAGTVKWLDATRNFGFIARENGPDVFIHGSAIAGTSYRRLEEGDSVEFEVEEGPKGLRAVGVVLLTQEAND